MSLSLVHTFTGHTDKCWATSIHSKLPLLATVSGDRTCRVYNLETKRLIVVLDDDSHSKTLSSVEWKPTGEFPSLAIGSFDSTISIWGNEEAVLEDEDSWTLMAIIEGHENEIKGVSWSHDGVYLASCSRDKSIWIWEADDNNEEFECVFVVQEHTQDVKHVTWHQHENVLASSSYDDTVKLFKQDDYDEDDWVNVADLTGHEGTVWSSDFEKKGERVTRLSSSSDDGTIRIWKILHAADEQPSIDSKLPSTIKTDTNQDVWELETILPIIHHGPIYSVAWGENGYIASVGSDGRIVVYKELNSKEWQIIVSQPHSHGVYEINNIKWHGDRLITAGDDGLVKLWELAL
ncbi:hypothetical protein LJB42_000540 [Komagataella kurtzmanii]|nr:hypothetical protein LJB42_000540 [Komagataella kurtzmanii]